MTERKGPGRPRNARNKTRIPKTTKTVKTCIQSLDLYMNFMYEVLLDKDDKYTDKNKFDAGKQVKDIALEIIPDELKAAAMLILDNEGEENPYRDQPTQSQMARLKELELEVEKKHPEMKEDLDVSPKEENVLSLIARYKE